MSVLVEFSMFPTDKGESKSKYVSKVLKIVKDSGVPYQLTAMGTIFETNTINEAMSLLEKAYTCLSEDCNRVYCSAKFDMRKNQSQRMQKKIQSVEDKL